MRTIINQIVEQDKLWTITDASWLLDKSVLSATITSGRLARIERRWALLIFVCLLVMFVIIVKAGQVNGFQYLRYLTEYF